ncbi:hypothetical protein L596_015764 [Steinernema carpocapsae]|uniref:Uncharacterized protein n=1 Tax=Steinernema carpocapsae TaxID=34508 RepID=A0A4V6A393_STECR|nr:hypothetical protein L596_015764 [Steinernema carpocapsae]
MTLAPLLSILSSVLDSLEKFWESFEMFGDKKFWLIDRKDTERILGKGGGDRRSRDRWLWLEWVVRMAPQEMLWLLSPFLTTTLAPLLWI